MSLSDRDKKIVLVIVPLLIAGGLLVPAARAEARGGGDGRAGADQGRSGADARPAQAEPRERAKTDFAADYARDRAPRQGDPVQVDMPSLLVQLDSRRRRAPASTSRGSRPASASRRSAPRPRRRSRRRLASSGTTPVDAGGAPAQSAPGQRRREREQRPLQTSAQRNRGRRAVRRRPRRRADLDLSGRRSARRRWRRRTPADRRRGGGAPAGLETVPLELEFVGDFFNLADFFHDMKRFVRVARTRRSS